jgi:hypothetical protein
LKILEIESLLMTIRTETNRLLNLVRGQMLRIVVCD